MSEAKTPENISVFNTSATNVALASHNKELREDLEAIRTAVETLGPEASRFGFFFGHMSQEPVDPRKEPAGVVPIELTKKDGNLYIATYPNVQFANKLMAEAHRRSEQQDNRNKILCALGIVASLGVTFGLNKLGLNPNISSTIGFLGAITASILPLASDRRMRDRRRSLGEKQTAVYALQPLLTLQDRIREPEV